MIGATAASSAATTAVLRSKSSLASHAVTGISNTPATSDGNRTAKSPSPARRTMHHSITGSSGGFTPPWARLVSSPSSDRWVWLTTLISSADRSRVSATQMPAPMSVSVVTNTIARALEISRGIGSLARARGVSGNGSPGAGPRERRRSRARLSGEGGGIDLALSGDQHQGDRRGDEDEEQHRPHQPVSKPPAAR